MNLYYCTFITTYLLVIFGPRVEGCTARPIKSDRMAICVETFSFFCKIMEQCRLCPAKSRSLHNLPRKITEPSYFAPQNYGAMQTLPRKITEPSYFAPQNHRAFILCPAKLWSNADFAPRNHGDIVSGANQLGVLPGI